ncbi:MAG: OmpA family protein [Phycisphaerales bacterium]
MDRKQMVQCAAGLALTGALLGGCKTVKKADYEAALQENTELRERIAGLQDVVRQANEQIAACENEKTALATESQMLRTQMASQTTQPAATNSGFENIPGVNVSGRTDAIAVEVAGDVLFASGSVTLKNSAKSSLDRIARVLESRYGSQLIRVEGYTDTDPIRKSSWKTNERLSSERALAVEAYLVSKGVDPDRIYAAAFGPANQRSTKQDSRRVEIVVLGAN